MTKQQRAISDTMSGTQGQINLANDTWLRAGKLGDQYMGTMQQNQQNLYGDIDKYQGNMDSLYQLLLGQQGNLLNAANAPTQVTPMDAKQLAEGYSPEAMAALQSQALNQIPGQYDTAISNLKSQMASRGFGGQGGSALLASQMGGIYGQKEQAKANALANITMGNEALRNQNIQANRVFNLGNLAQAQQFGLANKGLTLQGLMNAINAGGNLYNTQLSTLGALGNIYNPAQWGQLANQAIGNQNQALGVGMQGEGIKANLAPQRQGFWDQYGGSIMGAGLNLLTGGLGSLLAPSQGSPTNLAPWQNITGGYNTTPTFPSVSTPLGGTRP